MKNLLFYTVLLSIALMAGAAIGVTSAQSLAPGTIVEVNYDFDYGVACYSTNKGKALSCVKVPPAEKDGWPRQTTRQNTLL